MPSADASWLIGHCAGVGAEDVEAALAAVWSIGHFAGPDEEAAGTFAAEWSIGHDAGAEGAADMGCDDV